MRPLGYIKRMSAKQTELFESTKSSLVPVLGVGRSGPGGWEWVVL